MEGQNMDVVVCNVQDYVVNESSKLKTSNKIKIKAKKKSNKTKAKKEKANPAFVDIQRAWNVGYAAAQANLPETRNPFVSDSSEHQAWLDGWWAGFYDEPLYQVMAASN